MNRIIQILIKNHVFFTFIILELVSLKIISDKHIMFQSNVTKKLIDVQSYTFLKEKQLKNYFSLRRQTEELLYDNLILSKENTFLREQLEKIKNNTTVSDLQLDSMYFLQAKVVKNIWNKKQNFIMINQGLKHGVQPNMGVVSKSKLVGITQLSSDNFSSIISIINTEVMISAKIKNSGQFGTLRWNGKNINKMQLYDIPRHAELKIGDTIVTSGYSNIFPENIEIGTISKYDFEKNTNFLNIEIELFVDFTKIDFLYILKSEFKLERNILDEKIEI